MRLPKAVLLIGLLLLPSLAFAAPDFDRPQKLVEKFKDKKELSDHLKAKGFKVKGGIEKSKTDHDDGRHKSFPHFTSSFTVNGVTYPFTMVGYPPASGRTANLRSVIIPLRMNFVFFGQNFDVSKTFDPGPAVENILNSPLYQEADWPNGPGQFCDQLQRATFWNRMDPRHGWHVRMDRPRIARTIDIEVTPETGRLLQVGTDLIGDVLFDFMDAEILTILQLSDIGPDDVPIFVTGDVIAEALGYHNAFTVAADDGSEILQTYIYTSWLDPAKVDPIIADVSTFNHELAELINDPYINNIVPLWRYPPESDPRAECAFNPFLEVGDPQGNGRTFRDFPTIPVTLRGVTYHLQQIVLLQWFTKERDAFGGWFTFPDPTSLTVPAVYCQ